MIKLILLLQFYSLTQFVSPSAELSEYESVSHLDIGKYTLQYSRTFDKDGIITQKGQYHALTICTYGIMSYDNFIQTRDSVYYKRVVNQYKYFTDTAHVVYSDSGRCAGLPYRFDFKNLKAPWYSGMTQGMAVSFLLRYFKLTNDSSALVLSEKLVRLMLKSELDGGTISKTKEGALWIEEYPNCPKARSVLNGFVNGFIGLHEYCVFFPRDTAAAVVRDSCYNQMIRNLVFYDTPNWTTYSRNGNAISNSYLRYELEEFDHLYSLFHDERLRDQMKLWSRIALNKLDGEINFHKKAEYQFALQLKGVPGSDSCKFNDYTSFSKGLVEQLPANSKGNVFQYKFSADRYYCELKLLTAGVDTNKILIAALYKGKPVAITTRFTGNIIVIQSSSPFDELEVKRKFRRALSISLKSYDYKTCEVPQFAFYMMGQHKLLVKGKTYSFKSEGTNLVNAKVFYRYARPPVKATSKKFSIGQSFPLDGGSFVAPEDGTYEFFVSYDIVQPSSGINALELVRPVQ